MINHHLKNIFAEIPVQFSTELFQTLAENPHVKIERILSQGQASAPDFWYTQAHAEWVILLQGQARLQFAKDSTIIMLTAGDYLFIPAHEKHRVDWTDPSTTSIWLAIHLYENPYE
jgi:cupin 2 domain-containing protein